jgi:adenosylhomocysteine nucleosidase
MIVAVAALESELAGIRRQMKLACSYLVGQMHIVEGWLAGRECVLAQSGMGRERAEHALALVLHRYRPSAVVALGYSGALAAKLRAGDLVVCPQVHALVTIPTPLHPMPSLGLLACDHHLVARALRVELSSCWTTEHWLPRLRPDRPVGGGCLTLPYLASYRQMKEWLSWNFSGAVVDMESFWLGCLAQQARVPFLAVRAISDPLTESLPPLEGLIDAAGRTRASALSRYLLRHPLASGSLMRLGLHAHRAQQSLTVFFSKFVKDMNL